MLARFTQIDCDREIVLFAVDEDSETDRMLEVARIIAEMIMSLAITNLKDKESLILGERYKQSYSF